MNSLQNWLLSPSQCVGGAVGMKPAPSSINMLGVLLTANCSHKQIIAVKMAASGSKSSIKADDSAVEEVKSDAYSNTMTEAMGAGAYYAYFYRHHKYY